MDKVAIEALKASHPILDVLRELGIETRFGRFRCLRPENHAHGDRTPSVSVWPERGLFKCWVCPDVKGDVLDLVRLARKCSFREAVSFLGGSPDAVFPPPPGRRSTRPSASAPVSASTPASATASALPSTSAPPSSSPSVSPAAPASIPLPPKPVAGPQASEPQLELDYGNGAPAPASAPPTPKPASGPPGSGPCQTVADANVAVPAVPAVPAAPASGETSTLPPEDPGMETEVLRLRILEALLTACAPVGGAAGRYLAKRRIFRKTWEAQRLRMIGDYGAVARTLEAAFSRDDLTRTGFFNAAGHLRYYRHVLLFPYYDITGRAVYMQARALEADAHPKELSLSGPIPLPYNARLLDGRPGQIFLCEGVIDTLTMLEQGFPAVGVPGAANFKPAWAPLFRDKTVHVAFDPDGPGESGAAKAMERLRALGIEARRLAPPPGKDLNEWLRKG